MLAESTSPRADPLLPRPFEVRAVRRDTQDTATLQLAARTGPAVAFAPGQFTMIGRAGHREVPISISGDPAEPELLQQTVRAVGDATAALVASPVGATVLVRGPYGTGWRVGDAAEGDVLIVAGGIGLAPVRPALLQVLADRARYRRVHLVYGGRGPEHLLYGPELAAWRARDDLKVAVTVDAAPATWRGRVGLVTAALPADLDPPRTWAFLCGPEIMMRLTADALVQRGVPATQVRLSLERNMACGVGLCGHCMLREHFVCLDGPVFDYDAVARHLTVRGL